MRDNKKRGYFKWNCSEDRASFDGAERGLACCTCLSLTWRLSAQHLSKRAVYLWLGEVDEAAFLFGEVLGGTFLFFTLFLKHFDLVGAAEVVASAATHVRHRRSAWVSRTHAHALALTCTHSRTHAHARACTTRFGGWKTCQKNWRWELFTYSPGVNGTTP